MPFTTVQIDGGLDLKSSPIVVEQGRMQDCMNVEVAYTRGVRTISGYQRFDGGSPPSFARYWILNLNAIAPGTPWDMLDQNNFAGGTVYIDYSTPKGSVETLECTIVYSETEGPTTASLFFITNNSEDAQTLELARTSSNGYVLVGMTVNAVICSLDTCIGETYTYSNIETPEENTTLAVSSVAGLRAIQQAYYNAVRPEIQEVPGQGSVTGLFWLKDQLYASRDYPTLRTDDASAVVNLGDIVYQGASLGTATFSAEVVSFASSPTTGSPNSALLTLANVQGVAAIGALNNDTTAATAGNIEALAAEATSGGLYQAVGGRGGSLATQSWQHCDLGYSIEYANGVEAFPVLNRLQTQTNKGPLTKTTQWFVADGDGVPATTWIDETGAAISGANPVNTHVDNPIDGDSSYVAQTFPYNSEAFSTPWINNFGITEADINPSALITGLEFEVTRRCYRHPSQATGEIRDYQFEVKFADGSGGVQSGYNDTNWPRSSTTPDNTNYAAVTYGGEANALGYSVSPQKLYGSDFGFRFRPRAVDIAGLAVNTIQSRITGIRFRAHYIPPQGRVYFWNGSTAVVADVVQFYKKSGNLDTSDAAGVMYLVNVDLTRPVTAGEEIRSYPGDGVTPDGGVADNSTLLAESATSVQRNTIDPSSALAANRSKHQHVTANFSVAAGFEAIYAVSGAGPAWMYDGQAFSRIFTGLPDSEEKPRHLMVLQSRLMLGYEAGVVNFSSPGLPLTFDFLNFAGELGIGSPVRGMYPLNGDSGAVFAQSGVFYVKGDLSTGPYASTISPDVGCVEYTAQSMGQYLYTSFRGCQNLRATSAYGDFDSAQFSTDVWSWLQPRVQAASSSQSLSLACINSLPVRNKQQYRLFFADGWALSATFLDDGLPPQYTLQYYVKNDDDSPPMTWDVTMAAVESSGRDRMFGATNDASGYVYEMDAGTSFDGAAIDWFATLAFDDVKSPYQMKDWQCSSVFGYAQDFATFDMTRGANYEPPYQGAVIPQRFGSGSTAPSGAYSYFVSDTELRISGRNVAIRFQGSSVSQPPFVIQALSLNIKPMAEKQT